MKVTIAKQDIWLFVIPPTIASIMTWMICFLTINEYQKVSFSHPIVYGIAISFTVLYFIIAFFKTATFNDKITGMLKEKDQ